MKKSIFVLGIILILSEVCLLGQPIMAVADKTQLKLWIDSNVRGNNTISFTISDPGTVNVFPADNHQKILVYSKTLDPKAWSDYEAVWYIAIRAADPYLQGKNGVIGVSDLMWSVNGGTYKPLSTVWQQVSTHSGRQNDLFEDEIVYQLNFINETDIGAGNYKVKVEFEISDVPIEQ